ncbi:hypothetical protein D9M71_228400 [compost metagenome]
MHVVHRAVGGGSGGHRPQYAGGGAEAVLLAFQWCALCNLRVVQARVGLVFRPQRRAATDQEQRQHAGDDRPALAQVLDVVTEGEHQGRRNQNDRGHLEQVAPGRRVLERVRRVDAEEAAAIGAQLLDGDLAGRRAQRDGLVSPLQGQGLDVMTEGLRHALPDQQQSQQQAQRQQAVERGPGHVDPEVAQGVGRAPGNATAQRDQHGKAGGGADKVLHRQADHLAQVADRRFAAVGLPVGVGDKTHRRIERQRPLLTRQVLRIEWQVALQQQHGKHQHETGQVESQQGQGVLLPVVLVPGIDPGQPVAATLHRPQHRRQPGALALHHLVIETPEPGRREQHQRKERQQQRIIVTVHGRS